MLKRLLPIFAGMLFLVPIACVQAGNTNFVVNGDFETGDFTGWTIANQNDEEGSGEWIVYSGGILPISNFTFPPPPDGAYAAAADQTDPSSMILYQDITLPPDQNLTLHYTYYYNNRYETFISPDTLEIEDTQNQQARIDIMNPSTLDPYSVAAGDVLQNLLRTEPGSPLIVKPTAKSIDLTPYAGQTIRLRFAVADTEYYFSMGVDNISISVLQVLPPVNLTGKAIQANYDSWQDLVYRIHWEASPTPGVTKYLIFRNGVYINSVPNRANALFYDDCSRLTGEVDQYTVVAYVSDELQSGPATVIVR